MICGAYKIVGKADINQMSECIVPDWARPSKKSLNSRQVWS